MTSHPNTIGICVALILALYIGPALGAEDDFVLLTIEGDLIGLTEPFDGNIDSREEALHLVDTYHRLLPPAALMQIKLLHNKVLQLIPDFQVAYAAADSAEITHVMSEIDIHLSAMKMIYLREYTQEVTGLLNNAYQLILPSFGDK